MEQKMSKSCSYRILIVSVVQISLNILGLAAIAPTGAHSYPAPSQNPIVSQYIVSDTVTVLEDRTTEILDAPAGATAVTVFMVQVLEVGTVYELKEFEIKAPAESSHCIATATAMLALA